MSEKIKSYKSLDYEIPAETWSWNMYGPGIENIGRRGQPELEDVPSPAKDQLLVRVDSVGMCFSDVKLIQQGGQHPKLYNRDLMIDPTRLGHEAALTVIEVGADLEEDYEVGQRLAIQPDIYQDQISTAYGYTIPGGLTQYHLIGPEVLDADDGAYVIEVEEELGYAETALTEPWACVEAAYTQRRQLQPKQGGIMWIIGQPNDAKTYQFAKGLEIPGKIVTTELPESLREAVKTQQQSGVKVVQKDELDIGDIPALVEEVTYGHGFDDIVMLNPTSAEWVSEVAKHIAFRGRLNIVGDTELDGLVDIDVGRVHYHYTAYVGNLGPDIDASYGEARNRSELAKDGLAVFIGAGGPMGQMHVQRAIEMVDGPKKLILTEVNADRLEVLEKNFKPMAAKVDKHLIAVNPTELKGGLEEFVMQHSNGQGADDVVVSVPVVSLIEESARLLGKNGMLVLFAGVPNGSFAKVDLNSVFLHNAQLTGTSGSKLEDQRSVIEKALTQELSPGRAVAAIGGMEAAGQGIEAMMAGKYPGKVVIFPQLPDLPLMSLEELEDFSPEVAAELGKDGAWTKQAEEVLIERFWKHNEKQKAN